MKVRRALGYEKSITSILLEIMLYSYLMNPHVSNCLDLWMSFLFYGAGDGIRFSRASHKTVHWTVFSPIGEYATKVASS